MFHAETSALPALDLPKLICLSTIESPLTPDGDCVAGYRGDRHGEGSGPTQGSSSAFCRNLASIPEKVRVPLCV